MWARDDGRYLDLESATYTHNRGFATRRGPPATHAGRLGGRQRQLHRRWPKPVTVGVALRSDVSGGHVVSTGDGTTGVYPGANSVGDRRRKGAGQVTTVKGRDSSAADAQPLVEQVATALAQRCGVRGGDLVRGRGRGMARVRG